MRVAKLFPLIASGLALACGPSFQRVYDGDVKFEHCYATDEYLSVSAEAKRECWSEWRANYTYGQSRDRVDHAKSRFDTLSRSLDTGSDEKLVATTSPARNVAAPFPTNAFAPPPNMLPANEAAAPAPPSRQAPRAACSAECLSKWQSCKDTCKDKACDQCDRHYGQCVPGCFHEESTKRVTR